MPRQGFDFHSNPGREVLSAFPRRRSGGTGKDPSVRSAAAELEFDSSCLSQVHELPTHCLF